MYSLWQIDCDREYYEEGYISIQGVLAMLIQRLCDSQEPLYGNDHHPHHGHGDGDGLDGVSDVWNYGIVPITLRCSKVTNNNIVNKEEDD